MDQSSAIFSPVSNRGVLPRAFALEFVAWFKQADDSLFAPNQNFDIYSKVREELGPWTSPLHRRAVMMEVGRVLALFESSGNWNEGVDTSRSSTTTSENAEAGAWQVSYDARHLDPSLQALLNDKGITGGLAFQRLSKSDHAFAMEFIVRLLRIDVKDFNRIANGPVRKGDERKATWPNRPKLWDAKESIYPWLNREAVSEFQQLLS